MTYTRWGSKENEPVLNKNMDRGKAVIREGWHRTQSHNAVRAKRSQTIRGYRCHFIEIMLPFEVLQNYRNSAYNR